MPVLSCQCEVLHIYGTTWEILRILFIKIIPSFQGDLRMSANTKIVVLRRKELLYTGIFAALGVLFIILLLMLLLPGKDTDASYGTPDTPDSTTETAMPDNVADTSAGAVADTSSVNTSNTYIPGIYTTELVLGNETVNVEVIVNDQAITSVSLADPDETLITMYPLLEPTMESLNDQLCELQDPEQVTYSAETRYTSLVLLEAVKASLEKAKPKATPEGTGAPDATNAPTASPNVPKADINPAA